MRTKIAIIKNVKILEVFKCSNVVEKNTMCSKKLPDQRRQIYNFDLKKNINHDWCD